MGETITPKYKLVVFDQNGGYTACWQGRATDKRLAEYIEKYTGGLKMGGCNEHISRALGFIPVPYKAQVCLNRLNGAVVAEWRAPMFWVF